MSINPSSYKYSTINYSAAASDAQETGSIFSDDQSLYVLFNPVNAESDILSLTNSTKTEQNYSDEGDGNEIHDHELHSSYLPMNSIDRNRILESTATISKFDRISNWNAEKDMSELVDDNTASWNVDENITQTSIMKREFYGDELFKNFSKKELQDFRKYHLRNKLTVNDKNLINQMLIKLLLGNKDLQHYRSFTRSATLSQKANDYLNNFNGLEFSDTTSSLVLCGGEGASSSWNDI